GRRICSTGTTGIATSGGRAPRSTSAHDAWSHDRSTTHVERSTASRRSSRHLHACHLPPGVSCGLHPRSPTWFVPAIANSNNRRQGTRAVHWRARRRMACLRTTEPRYRSHRTCTDIHTHIGLHYAAATSEWVRQGQTTRTARSIAAGLVCRGTSSGSIR
ncbi:MAG: hypothetical protein RIT40_1644, partial [Planctomycetota bacterium]